MRKRIAPIALIVAALFGAACGDGDDSNVITEAKLQGYLLDEKDLPPGFEEQDIDEEEEEEDTEDGDTSCLEGVEDTVPTTAEASAEFATAEGTAQIGHDVEAYDPGKATEAMAEGRSVVEKCGTFEEDVEGMTMRGSLSLVDDFPNLGDDTVALAFQATVSNVSVNGLTVVVRQGDIITGVSYTASNAPIVRSVVEDLARKAVEKLG